MSSPLGQSLRRAACRTGVRLICLAITVFIMAGRRLRDGIQSQIIQLRIRSGPPCAWTVNLRMGWLVDTLKVPAKKLMPSSRFSKNVRGDDVIQRIECGQHARRERIGLDGDAKNRYG